MKRCSMVMAVLVAGALAGGYFMNSMLSGQQAAPPVIPRELTSYRDIAKKILPAVVSIQTRVNYSHVKGNRQQPFDDPRIPPELRKFFDNLPFQQEMPRHLGFGSGFFIRPEGVVLTNYHVVAGADQVTVTLKDGRKFVSRDIRGDRRTDLAVIRLAGEGKTFPYLELGDSDAMEIGDRVLAFGAPFGLTGSVTQGIVSAKGRNGFQMNMYEDFIQTDAAINPGNSGGPLVSLDGKVIGINAAIKTRTGGFQGVGLAVASNLAKNIVKALVANGTVHRGYLGVQVSELAPDVAERLGVKDKGVMVARVFDDTPASRAGVKEGDVVLSIAGKAIKDGRSLQSIVARLPLKKPAAVSILRDGKELSLNVTIEELPTTFGTEQTQVHRPTPSNPDSIGVTGIGVDLADLTPEEAENLGYRKGTQGALITRVEPGSLAFEMGLSRNMVISKVDNQAVTSARAARQAIEKASLQRGILLQIQSPQGGTSLVLMRQTRQE